MDSSPPIPRFRPLREPLVALGLLACALGCAPKSGQPAKTAQNGAQAPGGSESQAPLEVVRTTEPSPYFVKDGAPFCFVGTNNYYLTYKSKEAVRDLLDTAARMKLGVVRLWAFLDRGSLDGTVPSIHDSSVNTGVYFQYWDPALGRPTYNDGADGLEHLDWVVHEARQRGLLLTLVLTNNWRDFGGMDQYLRWYGLEKHHEFYSDERVRHAFKGWITHLVTRTNTIDGTRYVDDPAIFAWELANEPRTINYEGYDAADGWDAVTITRWADEMSAFVKSLDPNHMVSVGDEGFLNGGQSSWAYEAPYGVDTEAFARLPHVDFATYHLYPDHWGFGARFGDDWIEDHIALSRRVGKPAVLEEYGIVVRRAERTSGPIVHGLPRRQAAYGRWNDLVLERGGQASMFWMLSGIERPGELYPDYDHFTVYDGDPSYELLRDYAARMPTEAAACAFAAGQDHGAKSPFVSARPSARTQVEPER